MANRVTRAIARRPLLMAGVAAIGIGSIGVLGGAIGSGRTIAMGPLLVGPYRVTRHQDGRPGPTTILVPGSPGAALLERWLREHDSGWRMNWTSYVPARTARGDRFDLNFHDRLAILNYRSGTDPERWSQVSLPLAPGDVPDLFGPAPQR